MTAVQVIDNFMDDYSHRMMWQFLNQPGWQHGAYSADDGERYDFKHFAGYSRSGTEDRDPEAIASELRGVSPPLHRMWCGLRDTFLPGHLLSRCYANRMAPGVGGGLHRDSPLPEHVTAIYYPDLAWSPHDAGETLFYDDHERDVIKAVTPLPNRMVLFSGVIPHVARARSRHASGERITLMFKTLGAQLP